MINAPENNSFVAVGTNFTVPKISLPKSNSTGPYNVSIWTGLGTNDGLLLIGGDGNIMRAGVNISVSALANGSHATAYNAWYEWLPDHPARALPLKIAAGDIFTTTINTDTDKLNKTTGHITIGQVSTNGTSHFSKSHLAPNTNSSSALLGSCVDLAVSGDNNLANFGTVKFEFTEIGAKNGWEGGEISNLFDDAEIFTWRNNGVQLTDTKVLNGTNSVEIKYVGK